MLSCRRVSDVALIEAGKKTSCCHVTAAVCCFGRNDPATVLLLLIAAHSVVVSFTAATGDHDGERKLL